MQIIAMTVYIQSRCTNRLSVMLKVRLHSHGLMKTVCFPGKVVGVWKIQKCNALIINSVCNYGLAPPKYKYLKNIILQKLMETLELK